MQYKFPIIRTIDDILPHIEGRNEFFVCEKEGYTVVNYSHQEKDTFPEDNIYLPECRGLIFCNGTGKIIRRPFHKFFNLNEKEFTKEEILEELTSKNHVIMDKLDGSMVTPFMIGNHMRWGTKMGITDVSMKAEEWLVDKPDYTECAKGLLEAGYTPIFEWLDADTPIVIQHKENNLILIGIRDMENGSYVSTHRMIDIAQIWGVPVVDVKLLAGVEANISNWKSNVQDKEDEEGIIIRYQDGHMLKIKSDWYVQLHRVKSMIESERKVIELILDNKLDDIKGVVPDNIKKGLEDFESEFIKSFGKKVNDLWNYYISDKVYSMSRKDFALTIAPQIDKYSKSIMFSLMDGKHPPTVVQTMVRSNITNEKKFQQFNEEFLKCPQLTY